MSIWQRRPPNKVLKRTFAPPRGENFVLWRCSRRLAPALGLMDYNAFLDNLKLVGWTVPSRSFAYCNVGSEWQAAFVRIGGRYQLPGQVSFVVCVRHTSLRDREKMHRDVVKEPHDYPFKLTLEDLASERFQYCSKLLQYDLSHIGTDSDWSSFFTTLTSRVPKQLAGYSKAKLRDEIIRLGTNGYIEQIWAADLA